MMTESPPHDAQAFSFHTFLKKGYAKNFYSGFGLVISGSPPHDAQAARSQAKADSTAAATVPALSMPPNPSSTSTAKA